MTSHHSEHKPDVSGEPASTETDEPDLLVDEHEEEDEEIPLAMMIALIVMAIVIAGVYVTFGGGHQHFH